MVRPAALIFSILLLIGLGTDIAYAQNQLTAAEIKAELIANPDNLDEIVAREQAADNWDALAQALNDAARDLMNTDSAMATDLIVAALGVIEAAPANQKISPGIQFAIGETAADVQAAADLDDQTAIAAAVSAVSRPQQNRLRQGFASGAGAGGGGGGGGLDCSVSPFSNDPLCDNA